MQVLTESQHTAMRQLAHALRLATESGLFDLMVAECASPDSINDVCDTFDLIKKRAVIQYALIEDSHD